MTRRVALITGGASGIGRAIAAALVEDDVTALISDIDPVRTEDAASALRDRGAQAEALPCDVTVREQVDGMAKAVSERSGKLNMLFANAGVLVGGRVQETQPLDMAWMLAVNIAGVFHTVQAFLPLLQAAANAGEPAHIVVTGSDNSLSVAENYPYTIYTTTKHALLGFADALRRDLAGTGISVSLLCPGATRTELYDAKRVRQNAYGGAEPLPMDVRERYEAASADSTAQDPAVTAALCLEGMKLGAFYIVTDPNVRRLVDGRYAELSSGLDWLDGQLGRASVRDEEGAPVAK